MTQAARIDHPAVCVLICTADRPHLLDRSLRALAAGTEIPQQLVVVNGGSEEANEVMARYAAKFQDVILLQYANRNLATSRNLGLHYCSGDIVAMTDDDAEVAPDWIARLRAVHAEDSLIGAVGGAVEGTHSNRFLSRVADQVVFPAFTTRRDVRTLPGVNVTYKRQAIQQTGEFDESLDRGEDVDFNWRLMKHGYRLVYEPAIRVKHAHRPTLRRLLDQQYRYGRAYVLVRRKWPEMYCVYPHRLRSLHDWARLIHTALAVVYQPALAARGMQSMAERCIAYPVLVAHHLVWKIGMLQQGLTDARSRPNKPTPAPPVVSQCNHWVGGRLLGQEPTEPFASPQSTAVLESID